ncbi:MAG: class I SAM-dependent methyltransferase [Planctomycetes bacterium]|nr:class I SAM-dependent methyltransferase [Planctomycetota bacterium]
MTTQPDAPHARFLRAWWQRETAGLRAEIALYPAGRHTRWMLETLRLAAPQGASIAVLDDEPRASATIGGIPVLHRATCDPARFVAVIVSSDSIEPALSRKAESWINTAPPERRPALKRPYAGLPPGPYDRSHDDLFTRLLAAPEALSDEEIGDFAVVRRLPRAPELPPPISPVGRSLPVPPDGARSGYDGDAEGYLRRGRAAAEAILSAAAPHHPRPITDVLEWGCSSGRVLRHMPDLLPGAACWGCDIDAASINWAASHLAPPLRLFRSTTTPALPFEARSFDLVYAVSVFTHLSDHFDAWLMEIRRVLRPGGVLIATINDENVWATCRDNPTHYIARLCPRLDFSRPFEDDFITHGLGHHAQSFWHTKGVRSRWAFALDVLGFVTNAVEGQTAAVLRRADEAPGMAPLPVARLLVAPLSERC